MSQKHLHKLMDRKKFGIAFNNDVEIKKSQALE